GAWLVVFLILVTKASDMAAYAIGSLFGRHTLIQRISPKKTWEGAIAGFVASILMAFFCRRFVPQIPAGHILYLGAFLGLMALIGDLYESLLKRDCQTKDASSIFPGLGGMLDVIDSIIFTAPVFYFYIKYFL
ncbi:MAG: phosphatidate cytidylyltransferase, partial [Candidatus Omnitrophica bacterium CG10_big_fil_rev_8_21_14_0_10_43_8]